MGNLIIKGGKGAAVGNKIAKQSKKGAPRDGCFRDLSPATQNPGNPYTNPSTPSKDLRGTPPCSKKMGEN